LEDNKGRFEGGDGGDSKKGNAKGGTTNCNHTPKKKGDTQSVEV